MPKQNQGYLVLDHSFSPGLPDAQARRAGVDAGEGFFEADTFTCGHCSAVVVKHPLRVRERETCWKCDRWLCDLCATVRKMHEPGVCRNMDALVDRLQSLDPSDTVNAARLLADHQHFMTLRGTYG